MRQFVFTIACGSILAAKCFGLGHSEPTQVEGDFRITPAQEQEFFQPQGTSSSTKISREKPIPLGDPKRKPNFSQPSCQPTKTFPLPLVE
ncbi:MAG: hypothetical protein N2112_05875 [Gemmataceae bacterium]|jgi:hypothetical protein|nr:hypothetical protein [Gemmataceae bacterium]